MYRPLAKQKKKTTTNAHTHTQHNIHSLTYRHRLHHAFICRLCFRDRERGDLACKLFRFRLGVGGSGRSLFLRTGFNLEEHRSGVGEKGERSANCQSQICCFFAQLQTNLIFRSHGNQLSQEFFVHHSSVRVDDVCAVWCGWWSVWRVSLSFRQSR
jgi:hypothetical protein